MSFIEVGLLQMEDKLLANLLTTIKSMDVYTHPEEPVVKFKPPVQEIALLLTSSLWASLLHCRLHLKFMAVFFLIKLRGSSAQQLQPQISLRLHVF